VKRLLLVLLVAAVILSVGCPKAPIPEQETPTQIIKDITTEQASALIQESQGNPDFIIIDVRTRAEFDSGHIENAINLDYQAANFADELEKLDKYKAYLVYCKGGGRSKGAVDKMAELGFMEAYNMQGGINQWKKDGLPIIE
jgi:rhodanese-related sulfurtransferase